MASAHRALPAGAPGRGRLRRCAGPGRAAGGLAAANALLTEHEDWAERTVWFYALLSLVRLVVQWRRPVPAATVRLGYMRQGQVTIQDSDSCDNSGWLTARVVGDLAGRAEPADAPPDNQEQKP